MRKKLTQEDEDQLILLYKRGFSQSQIGKELGFNRRTICGYVKRLKAEGVITGESRVKTTTHKYRLSPEFAEKEEEIKKMYRKDIPAEKIAKNLGLSPYTIYKVINRMIEDGKLEKRKRVRSSSSIDLQRSKMYSRRDKEFAPTLKEGETIKCTGDVAKTCVFGSVDGSRGYCNYMDITRKSRAFSEGGCSWKACTKYSRVSENNKRPDIKKGLYD